ETIDQLHLAPAAQATAFLRLRGRYLIETGFPVRLFGIRRLAEFAPRRERCDLHPAAPIFGTPTVTRCSKLSSVTNVRRPILTVLRMSRPIRRHAVGWLILAPSQTSLMLCRRRRGGCGSGAVFGSMGHLNFKATPVHSPAIRKNQALLPD